jgi:hypothetical protein
MIVYILCFAPTLLAFLLIKNNNIKYITSIVLLIIGSIVLIEVILMHHSELHK